MGDVGYVYFVLFDYFVMFYVLQLYFMIGGDLFQLVCVFYVFGFDGDGMLVVLFGYFYFVQVVLVVDFDQLLCFDVGVFG